VRLEVGGVGGYGAAVGGFGVGGVVEGILGEGEVVEEVGVGGVLFREGGEELEGGGVVLLVEGFGGLGALGVLGSGLRLGGGVGGSGGELGVGRNRHEKEGGK
jgi:hypothetical protein